MILLSQSFLFAKGNWIAWVGPSNCNLQNTKTLLTLPYLRLWRNTMEANIKLSVKLYGLPRTWFRLVFQIIGRKKSPFSLSLGLTCPCFFYSTSILFTNLYFYCFYSELLLFFFCYQKTVLRIQCHVLVNGSNKCVFRRHISSVSWDYLTTLFIFLCVCVYTVKWSRLT